MTTMPSGRQPAASSSAWVLQRRSLNIWPEGDGVRGRGARPLGVPILDLVLPPPSFLTLAGSPTPAQGVASVDVARAGVGRGKAGHPGGEVAPAGGRRPLTSSVQ